MGYGRADSRDGEVFTWNFPLLGTYWTAANVAIQFIAKEWGGFDKLKGKKIALLYHDSPYGKEPIAALEIMAKKYGFEFLQIPVPAPGSEQKSQWLQIRQARPDYVLLWGWGIMNSAAVSGNSCNTPASNSTSCAASTVGEPIGPTMAKILSRSTIFCEASTAFFGS